MKKRNAAPAGKKRRIKLVGAAGVFLALMVWLHWGNTALEINHVVISSDRLPRGFDGYQIAHVSDLHNAQFGPDNEALLTLLRQAQPDLIAMTGDLVDSRRTDLETALAFAREAVEIAPCYYVTGNHEARIDAYRELEAGLRQVGVIVLRNEAVTLEEKGDSLLLLGIDDPAFGSYDAMDDQLKELSGQGYTVLLSHRPERFETYCANQMDLVLSGHAHGGQMRLPWVGGLVAPNQGLFPQYDAGCHTQGKTSMIVSRGLGNSIAPLRVNNRPEVISVKLVRP